jgi:putative transposase
MIDRTHPLSVSRQAQLLNISRGAVYYLPKPTSQRDLVLMNAIDKLHLDFPFMGSRQLRRALLAQGGNPPIFNGLGFNRSSQHFCQHTGW